MGIWESGPGMKQPPELEEGEAFYCKDDTNMDLDVAFSYIGEKVQNLLGQFQKDFDGEVSAENLGAKFGGYGSFLPVQQRSPQIHLKPKSPQRLQFSQRLEDPCISNYIKNPLPEGPARNSTVVNDVYSTRKNGSSSPPPPRPSSYPSKNTKTSSLDASIRKTAPLSSDNVSEAYPRKTELSHRESEHPTEQKTLKVRLKIGSDRMAQYNAEIHSLGLTSPSSSMGNSPEGSGRLEPESDECPDESPSKILQIMTSFLVDGGSVLSPLPEYFSNLGRRARSLAESERETTSKSSAVSPRIREKGVSKWKKSISAAKIQNLERSENELVLDSSNIKQKNSGSDLSCKLQQVDDFNSRSSGIICSTSNSSKGAVMVNDALRKSEKDVPLKKRKGSKDKPKGRSISSNLVEDTFLNSTPNQSFGNAEHLTSISHKDISVRPVQDVNSQVHQSCGLIKESYSDISECERTEVADLSSKVCWKAASMELDGPGLSNDVKSSSFNKKAKQSSNKLALNSSNTSRNGYHAVSNGKDNRKKESRHSHLSQRDVVDMNTDRMGNPKCLLEKSSGNGSKNSNLDTAKKQLISTDKLKESLSSKTNTDTMASETFAEPPAETIPCNEANVARTGETLVNPVLIQEDWVGCDRCEKWRLLPYGTKSNQLPDKWVCSMLNWLPGMNSCDVSEDETTSAVRASLLVPAPLHQHNVQAQAEGPFSGLNSSNGRHYTPNPVNYVPDSSKTVQYQSLEERNSKETFQSLGEEKSMKKSTFPHPNKPAVSVSKIKKRKHPNMVGDDANLSKKIRKESFQDVPEAKSIKSKVSMKMEDFRVSGDNPNMIDHKLNPVRDKKKLGLQTHRSILSKDSIKSSVSKQKGQTLEIPDNVALNVNVSSRMEVSRKKRKFKDCEDSDHQVKTLEENINGNREKDVYKKDKGKGDAPQKTKDSDLPMNCKVPIKKDVDKKWKLKNFKVKLPLTKQDIEELKKDLGCEQFSMAATSSSSKISHSRKNRGGFMGAKDSPEESVSSSPMRMPYVNQVLPSSTDTTGMAGSKVDDFSLVGKAKKSLNVSSGSKRGITKKGNTTATSNFEPIEKTDVDFRECIAAEKPLAEHVTRKDHSSDFENSFLADNEMSNLEHGHGHSSIPLLSEQNPRKKSSRNSSYKSRTNGKDIDGLTGKLSNPSTGSEILNAKEKMKEEMDAGDFYGMPQYEVLSNGKHPFSADPNVISAHHNSKSMAPEKSLVNENISNITASTGLKEARDSLKKAEELKNHAYLIKNSGFSSESNYEYFKAALMFLHGASLAEAYNGGSTKCLDINPLQLYSTAAKLCETCASEYEKGCELAAATLAYKCMEVAYLRIIYCNSSTNRIFRDMQSSFQMTPLGESPSSSASDVDNLYNLTATDRSIFPKGSDPQAVSLEMSSRNRANFVRVLDFTKDAVSAMEASKKLQDTYSKLQESHNKKAIIALKGVIDFSFHDVEQLITSVRLAFDAINRQAPIPSSTRDQ